MTQTTIDPADLSYEMWPPRDLGGQHVGVSSGVKVTHLPTGLVAICHTERSQHRNKNVAVDMLLGGITSPHFRG
jgi:protein subunit release factor A